MNRLKAIVILAAVLAAGSAYAGGRDIRHQNLHDAYQNCNHAIRHIDKAYRHNKNHGAFGGHASMAKQLLREAKHEIEEADEFRNHHR